MLLAELAREYQMNILIGDYKYRLGDGYYIDRLLAMLDVSRRMAMLLAWNDLYGNVPTYWFRAEGVWSRGAAKNGCLYVMNGRDGELDCCIGV